MVSHLLTSLANPQVMSIDAGQNENWTTQKAYSPSCISTNVFFMLPRTNERRRLPKMRTPKTFTMYYTATVYML
jgi:hypothetical protein